MRKFNGSLILISTLISYIFSGVCANAATTNDGLVFTRYTTLTAQDVQYANPGLKAEYIPTRLLPNDSFEGALKFNNDTLCIYYDDEVLIEGKNPASFRLNSTLGFELKNGVKALCFAQKHGEEVQFKLDNTYVLIESSRLTETQLLDEAGTVTPVNG